jgi:hypothetical protein
MYVVDIINNSFLLSAKVIVELAAMVAEVCERLKNREQSRKLFVNYFMGERISVGMVLSWIRLMMKEAGIDTSQKLILM